MPLEQQVMFAQIKNKTKHYNERCPFTFEVRGWDLNLWWQRDVTEHTTNTMSLL